MAPSVLIKRFIQTIIELSLKAKDSISNEAVQWFSSTSRVPLKGVRGANIYWIYVLVDKILIIPNFRTINTK